MLDSNMVNALDLTEDPEHNLCGQEHNPHDASCSSNGGPPSLAECKNFFWQLWAEQQLWVMDALSRSTATWQIIVTHFPCGHEPKFYGKLHTEYGLDLLVTGHRHDQELWEPGSRISREMANLTCFVTGGGGGITSEATPNSNITTEWYGEGQYGFYDLTISKEKILIESINWDGKLLRTAEVTPTKKPLPLRKAEVNTTTRVLPA